jgi:hypothetical protein
MQLALDVSPFELRQLVAVFPNEITGASVQRVYDVVGLSEIHDTAMDERGSLLISQLLRPRPSQPQIADVGFVDLFE